MVTKKKCLAALVAVSLMISGCATTSSNGTSSGCSPATGALIGALLGALVGGKGDFAKGAAIGAAAGALSCVAFNAYSQKTASAEEVRRQHAYRVETPTLVEYQADGLGSVSKGSDLVINTRATVVTPQSGGAPTISEKLILTPPGQTKGPGVEKVLAQEGGSFYQTYTVPISRQLPAGEWQFFTTLYIDGKPVSSRSGKFTVI
jgi:hypothetical protein